MTYKVTPLSNTSNGKATWLVKLPMLWGQDVERKVEGRDAEEAIANFERQWEREKRDRSKDREMER